MILELLVIVVLVLANGLFAGAEIAVVGMDRIRLRQLVDDGRRGAAAVQGLRANAERFFATVQIVITVVGAAAGAFGGATFARDLQPLLVPVAGAYAGEVAFVIVVGIIAYLSLVFGELVPKSLALRHAERYATLVAPLLSALAVAARPVVWLLTASSNVVLAAFGDKTTFAETRRSLDELRDIVDEASEVGSIDPDVGEIASRALDFATLKASDIMIPRTRIVAIPRGATQEEIRQLVLEHGHSRVPVYEDDLDVVVGYVLYKDLLPLAWEGSLIILEDLVRSPYFVVEGMRAVELLHEMRQRRTHLAVVVDEHGGTAGIVTLDDLIDEMVGEVLGEVHAPKPPSVRPEPDGSLLVQGDMPIRELNRTLDVELPERPDWTTIGGLTMFLAGAVPKPGTVVRSPDGTKIRVEAASDRAVQMVRLVPPERKAAETDD